MSARIKISPLGPVVRFRGGKMLGCPAGWLVACTEHGEIVDRRIGSASGDRCVSLIAARSTASQHCAEHRPKPEPVQP